MPTPLTWNSGLVWNSSTPGAVWNGVANSNRTTMTQDLINLGISDADWTAIDAALTTLEEKLGTKLLDLTVEQRSRLTKMGDKSEAFCRQALITGRQNAAKLPTDTASDLTAEEAEQLRLRIGSGRRFDLGTEHAGLAKHGVERKQTRQGAFYCTLIERLIAAHGAGHECGVGLRLTEFHRLSECGHQG